MVRQICCDNSSVVYTCSTHARYIRLTQDNTPTPHTNYYANLAETTDEKTQEAVLDSGATHTFFPSTYKTDREQANVPGEGILVGCARDGIQLKSYATDEAVWPSIPRRACKGHKLHHLMEALASVRRFAESGCEVHFLWEKALILDNQTKEVLMEAPFNAKKGLYTLPLNAASALPIATREVIADPIAKAYNITVNNYTIPGVPQMIKFMQAAAGYPVISTWLKAIRKNHFMSWPGLCAETVRRHLLPSPHTSKGHMKMVQQNRHAKTETVQQPIKTAHNVEYRIINTEDLPKLLRTLACINISPYWSLTNEKPYTSYV